MPGFLNRPTRHLFFTGKGGVGKTSLSAAAALSLADVGKKGLWVSHAEPQRTERIGGLRAAVHGANDEIMSAADLVIGVSRRVAGRCRRLRPGPGRRNSSSKRPFKAWKVVGLAVGRCQEHGVLRPTAPGPGRALRQS